MAERMIKLTEEEIKNLVKDTIRRILEEGIDVDSNRNVTMTDRHEKLVDTSVDNNPTMLGNFIPSINVWSIFKRKDGNWGDGNPLLYALKGEKGYELITKRKFYSRLEYLVKKFFAQTTGIDVTIAVPSSNQLNRIFADTVAKNCINPKFIDNLFVKMSTEEVADYVFQKRSAFRRYYGRYFDQKYKILKHYLKRMPYDTFQFHKVEDMEMRRVIEKTIKLSDEFYGDYIDSINNKNILIVDDSLTFGNTISEACKIIAEAYTPKSITVLTLFSPLYREDGSSLKNGG